MNGIKQSNIRDSANNVDSNVTCEKCQSSKIVTKKRGYHSKRMLKVFFSMLGIGAIFTLLPSFFLTIIIKTTSVEIPTVVREDVVGIVFGVGVLTLFLSFPASIMGGMLGSQALIYTCSNCGHQWSEENKNI